MGPKATAHTAATTLTHVRMSGSPPFATMTNEDAVRRVTILRRRSRWRSLNLMQSPSNLAIDGGNAG
ncbi:hypothetical protein BF49_3944 [Bradyrhizobium sp.]|nr:hypothetical protein BF49_3944 [Bradyrhizobium sp.]